MNQSFIHTGHMRNFLFRKWIAIFIAFISLFTGINPQLKVYAQTTIDLPLAGQVIRPSTAFNPPHLVGIKVFTNKPLNFDFILDKGDVELNDAALKAESLKMIRYFLAGLAIPQEDLWVNLSPYERDHMIDDRLAQTELGRDLLAQDYTLKQLTASSIYPEGELGKQFWQGVYQKIYDEFGISDVPINTFHKIWIVPDKVVVYENRENESAFVIKSRLKLMMDEDYLALRKNLKEPADGSDEAGNGPARELNQISTKTFKDVVLPEIEREVNEGKNFANLRQIYDALILAAWYKRALKESVFGKNYADQMKLSGIDVADPGSRDEIYKRYTEAYQKGIYDYVKEEYDQRQGTSLARHYFSGGITVLDLMGKEEVRTDPKDPDVLAFQKQSDRLVKIAGGVDAKKRPEDNLVNEDLMGGQIKGNDVTDDELNKWLEKILLDDQPLRQANSELFDTLQGRIVKMLERLLSEKDLRLDLEKEWRRQLAKPIASDDVQSKVAMDLAKIKAALGNIAQTFSMFTAKDYIFAKEKYLLGDSQALAVDFFTYLQRWGKILDVPDMDLEYVVHEALERTILSHNDIIALTRKIFDRDKYIFAKDSIPSSFQEVAPGRTPLGRVARQFISENLLKKDIDWERPPLPDLSDIHWDGLDWRSIPIIGKHSMSYITQATVKGIDVIRKVPNGLYITKEKVKLERLHRQQNRILDQQTPRVLASNKDRLYLLAEKGNPFVLQNMPVDLKTNLEIIFSLLGVLYEIHKVGYSHCDVKSDNIIFDKDNLKVTLLDFGLSGIVDDKLRGQEEDIDPDDILLGSFDHMPPEALDDTNPPYKLNQQFDVYSAGIILYQMMHDGALPSFGSGDIDKQIHVKLMKDFNDDDLTGWVPKEMRAVIIKAMARKPEYRYESIKAMAADLFAFAKKWDIEISYLKRFPEAFDGDFVQESRVDPTAAVTDGKDQMMLTSDDPFAGKEVTANEFAQWQQSIETNASNVLQANSAFMEDLQKRMNAWLNSPASQELKKWDSFQQIEPKLRNIGGGFKCFEAKKYIFAKEKYLLGSSETLAVDFMKYLQRWGEILAVSDLDLEYVVYESLAKTISNYNDIIALTRKIFDRDKLIFIDNEDDILPDIVAPEMTPIGRVARQFITENFSKDISDWPRPPLPDWSGIQWDKLKWKGFKNQGAMSYLANAKVKGGYVIKKTLETGQKYSSIANENIKLERLQRQQNRILDQQTPKRLAFINEELYLLFEKGKPLHKNRPVDLKTNLEIIFALLGVLHEIHKTGYVHRDVKPDNIIFDENNLKVTLLDFGFSGIVDSKLRSEEEEPFSPDPEDIVGSVQYMPPEALKGEAYTLNKKFDVYSAGVILYWLLQGDLPFTGQEDVWEFIEDKLNIDITDKNISGWVPKEIRAVVIKAMARKPEDRYESIKDMAADLFAFAKKWGIEIEYLQRFPEAFDGDFVQPQATLTQEGKPDGHDKMMLVADKPLGGIDFAKLEEEIGRNIESSPLRERILQFENRLLEGANHFEPWIHAIVPLTQESLLQYF